MDRSDLLNDRQRQAVEHEGSHLLLVAGPGTGKTRTLVSRIQRMSGRLTDGQKVLAVTFTNKAAEEMRERLEVMVPQLSKYVEAGTFHSFCLRLLRTFAGRLAFPLNFTIASPDEVEVLAAEYWPELSRRDRRSLLESVARWKATFADKAEDPRINGLLTFLRGRGVVDFDDILRDAVLLLKNDPDVLETVRRRYPLVMVDEFQDVSAVQVELLKLLAGPTEGTRESCGPVPAVSVYLTVIGDPNQSIYGFRGSDLRFFDEFDSTFVPCQRIELEENYRSTAKILAASREVISVGGGKVRVPQLVARVKSEGFLGRHEASSDRAEAVFVAQEIAKLIGGAGHHAHAIDAAGKEAGSYSFGDIAVLFRLNVQARALEEALQKEGLPYQTAGVRPAGISLKTRRTLQAVRQPADLPYELMRLRESDPVLEENWDQVMALAAAATDVASFLDRLSLETPEDAYNARAEKVALLTLHAAKGLEFPVVFLVGCEEGLLPLEKDFLETDPEEERRLFYVGMTRARERLYFVRAQSRSLFGQTAEHPASSFLTSIRADLEESRARPISRKRQQEKEQFKLF